jgi:hypothetical protein
MDFRLFFHQLIQLPRSQQVKKFLKSTQGELHLLQRQSSFRDSGDTDVNGDHYVSDDTDVYDDTDVTVTYNDAHFAVWSRLYKTISA